MPRDHQFGLFQDDAGRSWRRAPFADLDGAKRKTQKFADEERQEFLVRKLEDYSEVARMFPSRTESMPGTGLDRNRPAAERKGG
jgi:hypothetical protein